jgi:hypothetical protein
MGLGPECPRCPSPVAASDGPWRCPDHGTVTPLWRPEVADYESFAEHLGLAGEIPTLVPWPLAPAWSVTDFGVVSVPGGKGRACVLTCGGPSDLDGIVEVTIVSEEPGVGLGARCAGLLRTDPGGDVGEGPAHAKVRIDGHPVPLWSVLTSDVDVDFDRSVFVGEAHGRWLYLVLRPASAALLLEEEWLLVDLAGVGPALVDLPFADTPPAW